MHTDNLPCYWHSSVCYFVPIRTCFQLEVKLFSAEFWWDVIVDIYFVLDLILNFRTAIYNDKGALVTDGALLAIAPHLISHEPS